MPNHFTPPRWRIALVREQQAPGFPASCIRTSRDVAEAFAFLNEADRGTVLGSRSRREESNYRHSSSFGGNAHRVAGAPA